MKSLKPVLLNLIKDSHYLSFGEMCQFVAEEGYKVSYAERLLRYLVEEEKITNEWRKSKRNTKYISGYFFRGSEPIKRKVIYKEKVLSNGETVMIECYE